MNQDNKLHNSPLFFVGRMWAELVEWGKRHILIEGGELASEADFAIPRCTGTTEDTRVPVRETHEAWRRSQED